jgi:hypothetical protein
VGSLHEISNAALAAVTVGASKVSGIVRGVTVALLESTDSPAALVAVMVTVYVVPLVSSVMSQVNGPLVHEHEYCEVPSSAVAVYPVISDPPVLDGAVQLAVMVPSPGVNDVIVGAPGTVIGVAVSLSDAVESPAALVAITVTVYVVPFVRSKMVQVKSPEVQLQDFVVVPSVA